jgi:hypothetical protein
MDFDDDTPLEYIKDFKMVNVQTTCNSHEFSIKALIRTTNSIRVLAVSFPKLKYSISKNHVIPISTTLLKIFKESINRVIYETSIILIVNNNEAK